MAAPDAARKGSPDALASINFRRWRASLVIPVARVLTWGCVILLAVLSLWPGRGIGFLYVLPEFNSMRTGLPGQVEHFIAYAGSAGMAMAGYRASWVACGLSAAFWCMAL